MLHSQVTPSVAMAAKTPLTQNQLFNSKFRVAVRVVTIIVVILNMSLRIASSSMDTQIGGIASMNEKLIIDVIGRIETRRMAKLQ